MKTDIEILTESLKKYRDKKGKKAMALKERIDGYKALAKIFNWASKPLLK